MAKMYYHYHYLLLSSCVVVTYYHEWIMNGSWMDHRISMVLLPTNYYGSGCLTVQGHLGHLPIANVDPGSMVLCLEPPVARILRPSRGSAWATFQPNRLGRWRCPGSLWWFNMGMEYGPFMDDKYDDWPIKTWWFSISDPLRNMRNGPLSFGIWPISVYDDHDIKLIEP